MVVDVPCFEQLFLTGRFRGQKWKLGHQKDVVLEVPVRGDGGASCSGGGRGVAQEVKDSCEGGCED